MTPSITSERIITRIEVLEKRLEKKERHKLIRHFNRNEIKDIKERLQLNWDRLYEFYPELIGIKNIQTFRELISSGYIPNKFRLDVYKSKIYIVGSEEYKEFIEQLNNRFEKGIS